MHLTLLHEIPEDSDLRRQWNALVSQMERPQVFYTYEWALAVYRAYGQTLRPLLFLAHDESGSLSGVAALAAESDRRPVTFLCATTGDYCDFISSAECREEFVSQVLADLRQKSDELRLANLPADSATAVAFGKLAATRGYHLFSRTGYLCAQVSLALLERRWDAKPVLPRKKMLRRFLNAMGREAPVRLDHARSWSEIEPVLPELVQAHVSRFLVTGRISNMARSERRHFLAELAQLLSEQGWVVLTRMMSGSKVFAWNYGFEFRGTWFWYQPTFDNDLEKYSPGFCLLAKLIEEAADDPELKLVDLGLGAEEYKDRFANQTRETRYVTLHASLLASLRERLRYSAAVAVRRLPVAETAARTMLNYWRRLREHVREDGIAATVLWLARRLRDMVWLRRPVDFYQWSGGVSSAAPGMELRRLDWNALAAAASEYVDDPATAGYLLRAAGRLQNEKEKVEGFALQDKQGKSLHFAWATAFEGFFLSELNTAVEAPSGAAIMIFDCWTPAGARGKGYYGRAIGLMANLIEARRKTPWIFSAAKNEASVRGLAKTAFRRRYGLVRKRLFGMQWIDGRTPVPDRPEPREISAGPADSAA